MPQAAESISQWIVIFITLAISRDASCLGWGTKFNKDSISLISPSKSQHQKLCLFQPRNPSQSPAKPLQYGQPSAPAETPQSWQ